MTKAELKKGIKVWCCWKSRYIWYTGIKVGSIYVFEDICDVQINIKEDQLNKLEIKK